jgi:hypothetical protein
VTVDDARADRLMAAQPGVLVLRVPDGLSLRRRMTPDAAASRGQFA